MANIEKLLLIIRSLSSPLGNRLNEIMRVFDCNPDWPICMYDFSF